jgi:hypothetical protein
MFGTFSSVSNGVAGLGAQDTGKSKTIIRHRSCTGQGTCSSRGHVGFAQWQQHGGRRLIAVDQNGGSRNQTYMSCIQTGRLGSRQKRCRGQQRPPLGETHQPLQFRLQDIRLENCFSSDVLGWEFFLPATLNHFKVQTVELSNREHRFQVAIEKRKHKIRH